MTSPVLVDLYSGDLNGKPDLAALVAAGLPWAGVMLKATEGVYYPKDSRWFDAYWPAIKTTAGSRYGVDFFRGAYHYFRVDEDPVAQADFYLSVIQHAGGFSKGDLWPVVDVESAENPVHASAQQVIEAVSAFSWRIIAAYGKAPVLYAGSYIRDRQITDHMGCELLWTAAYGSALLAHLYTNMGWKLSELFAWQYQGTDFHSGPIGYPQASPIGPGPVDLSAVTIQNGLVSDYQLAWIRSHI